ncbi:hypothetical protein [Ancylomarina longa]|uniref:CD-NTase-associated protein 16 NUDIX domain-containing protein n=1 Tax=Ancylomarina longa TaxID=2487017 RepID=A0A434AWN5_9BACT|nr:hypothetical protein [Ancylomarina longa]RUT78938.1 hypothetical protein DLK05_05505 [Ancylomarina longa]
MKESYSKVINLILAILLGIVSQLVADTETQNLFLAGCFATGLAAITNWLSWGLENRSLLRTLVQALFIRRLRLSCSYLYKIEVEDKYLLVQSRKHKKYQPVGGNFKRGIYSNSFLNKLEVEPDDKFTNDGRSKDDLRLHIKGYRFGRFLRWYNQPNKEREVSYDREFYEELIESRILPKILFPYPIVNFRKQIVTQVKYSEHLNCKEVHIYDIIELVPTTEQLEYLKEMQAQSESNDFKWVDANVIRSQGFRPDLKTTPFPITDHSAEILI